jgi:hypothetical protein
MRSSSKGFALIDKIIIGTEQIQPILIDSKSNELSMYLSYDDCHYLDHYRDYWAFGCAVEPEIANEALGYWSPCKEKECKIQFTSSPTILPSNVIIKAYIEGDAKILLVNSGNGVVIKTLSATQTSGWIEFDVRTLSYVCH